MNRKFLVVDDKEASACHVGSLPQELRSFRHHATGSTKVAAIIGT